MSSEVLETTITRVTSSDNLSNEESNSSEDDCDSDHDLDDNRYDVIPQELSSQALDVLKDLYLNNGFNKLEIIQTNSEDVIESPKVCHCLLLDDKPNDNTVDEMTVSENDCIFRNKSKFIKQLQEKCRQKGAKNVKKSLKSDVQMNLIPKSFDDLLEIIFSLNAVLIEDKNSKIYFREETHNREIQFKNHDFYVNAFIPFIVREFWSALKKERQRDHKSYDMTYCLSKTADNEMICTHIRHKTYSESVFKFAQIVVLNYPLTEDNGSECKRFGIVKEVKTSLIDKTSDIMSNQLILSQTQTEDQNDEQLFIYEELIIVCNCFETNIDVISVMPMICVQQYLLGARVVFDLKKSNYSNVFTQILKPNFKLGITGYSVNLDHRKNLFDYQKDAIQKGYDVCTFPEINSFAAINGRTQRGKTEILKETVLQLIKIAEKKVEKVIVITSGRNEFISIIDFLKSHEINVFHIDGKGNCLSHKRSDLKRKIRKMDKELMFDKIKGKNESIEGIKDFYSNETMDIKDLSVRDQCVKEKIDFIVNRNLMIESQVIIGSITDIMNDEFFNYYYNSNDNNTITCALIDNAHRLTEAEMLTLLCPGVEGFVLYGDDSVNASSFERCESFFQRYIRLFKQSYRQIDCTSYSVIHIRDSIDSMQRFAKRDNFRPNYSSGHKRGNKAIEDYRRVSNYGSEFFKKKDRFKDMKPFVNESKDYKHFGANRPNRGRGGHPSQQRGRFGYHRGGRGSPRDHNPYIRSRYESNLMTEGVVTQMPRAFGNRESYVHQNDPQNDFNDFQSNNSNFYENNGSRDGEDIQYYGQSNQFVTNPTNNQNYYNSKYNSF